MTEAIGFPLYWNALTYLVSLKTPFKFPLRSLSSAKGKVGSRDKRKQMVGGKRLQVVLSHKRVFLFFLAHEKYQQVALALPPL